MFKYFSQMETELTHRKREVLSVAVAQDEEVLLSVKEAYERGIVDYILVGDQDKITPIIEKIGMKMDSRIVHEPDDVKACLTAVSLIRNGEASVLIKGLVNTSHYLRAVLNNEVGLRTGRLLSAFAAYEIPRDDRFLFATDTGLNIEPTATEKIEIIRNAVEAMEKLGIEHPYIGILAANELVNPKMKVTMDAAEIVKCFEADADFKGTIEGPVSLDVAVSAVAAKHKGITSKIAGKTELFVFPTVESGNIWSKSMIHYANINAANVILGATHPIILVSRADEAKIKVNSIILACYLASKGSHA